MMTLTKEDLQAIEGLFTGKFDSIDRRFDAMDKRLDAMDERFDSMDKRLDAMDKRFDALETKVENIDLRLEHVESDVSSLKIGQQRLQEKLNQVSDKVDATYELALENWGQIEESKKRLEILEG